MHLGLEPGTRGLEAVEPRVHGEHVGAADQQQRGPRVGRERFDQPRQEGHERAALLGLADLVQAVHQHHDSPSNLLEREALVERDPAAPGTRDVGGMQVPRHHRAARGCASALVGRAQASLDQRGLAGAGVADQYQRPARTRIEHAAKQRVQVLGAAERLHAVSARAHDRGGHPRTRARAR
ncbi:MAG: hypothetical protein U0704_12950 [Candidatus Eisenbacteria bacterium]